MEFSKDTFRYFDLAKRNSGKKEWFEKNEALYSSAVKKPMQDLVVKIWDKYADDLPGIQISPKKVTKPIRNKDKVSPTKSLIKLDSSFFLAEKATSRFEWNPGIYFQVGAAKEENLLGIGMYMVSSRQMKKMRQAIADDFSGFHKIMSNRTLKKRWGGLSGETYTRFPKEYDETAAYAQYLKHKNFFLVKHYTREDFLKKTFKKEFMKDLDAAMPFFDWVRNKVGTYKAPAKFSFRDDD